MIQKLFIYATNVHQGGGRSLLSGIISALPNTINTILFLDVRMILNCVLKKNTDIELIPPTLLNRFLSEFRLFRYVSLGDVVLCFGNLPPLFKLRGRVIVFLQNRYLVDDICLNAFPFNVKLRLQIERLWFIARIGNVDEFIVQTPSMKSLLEARTKGKVSIRLLPFTSKKEGYSRGFEFLPVQDIKNFSFLFVASGEPHKNHRQLVYAWCLLANEGYFPTLKITLDQVYFSELCMWIDEKTTRHHLNIENLGSLPGEKVKLMYEEMDALIYPSNFESLGLPLIEARQAGLPILASELDYVRDVVDPEQTFDPESPVSIARAVKRFLGINEQPLPLMDATQFIASILSNEK